jgi:glutamate dehydrogenase
MLISAAAKRLPEGATDAQQKLLTLLGESIADEDLCCFTPELLASTAETHWKMAVARPQAGSPMIKVQTVPAGAQPYRMTVVDVAGQDMAFLVDSIAAEVNRHDLLIALLNHPVLYMRYKSTSTGAPEDVTGKPTEGYEARSHVHLQIRQALSGEAQESLAMGLAQALGDVHLANRDWAAMREKLREAQAHLESARTDIPAQEMRTYCDFLDYLHENNFTFLGYREYQFTEGAEGEITSATTPGASLGVLHDGVTPAYINEKTESLPAGLQAVRRNLPPVAVSKTNRVASVHRRVPMDAVAVKVYGKDGKVVGEKLFLGLFTSVVYSRSILAIPLLREKVEAVQAAFGFMSGSHNHKTARHILEKYPRDELFQMDIEALKNVVGAIMRLAERQRIALFTRPDTFGRYVSCLVYIPRDRFGTGLRQKMQDILEASLSGRCTAFSTIVDDSVFARAMYTIAVDQAKPPQYDLGAVETLLQEAGRNWAERLTVALASALADEEEVARLAVRYADAFPLAYQEFYAIRRAVYDIAEIERVLESGRTVVDLFRPTVDGLTERPLRLKVYHPETPLPLSDVLPILDNMGLRAVSEMPFKVQPEGSAHPVWIHDVLVEAPRPVHLDAVKTYFEHAFLKVWTRETESDALNRLVLAAPMNWHEVAVLRAYVRYLKQTGYPLGRTFVERTLVENPVLARLLTDLFKALHRPGIEEKKERPALVKSLEDKISYALEDVASLDQDRLLRALVGLIQATVRTNYFQRRENGLPKPYLALKIESRRLEGLPLPRPFMEIFVSSPRVEGVHLRGDRIARGGLRWSDRPEDYRTEILGLMKAQMIKNAVIVPMGSKGGFVVKNPSLGDRAALQAEGVECYKTFIRALLDITDNRVGDRVVGPKNVVRRDGDDPYLVVAADKGTATFSDIANTIASEEYAFWLGDAFASGGSAGYDHKKMGITARGAWESVKGHFRALGHDTQKQPFDVVGVGDMGGDVFGNGMLCSDRIRLIGAFNHVHIFCDPDPNPKKSFVERQRLFEAVQGWDEYDQALLSKGGRIYDRADKIITLTPEIMARFDIAQERVTPQDLIRAILSARADLAWFGGIGTYVKGPGESHVDAGDKANDALRVDADALRVRVVGEGANLGMTQAARVAFAQAGGRVNTDFIDNSAGVDCSDHEVNTKILLSDVMSKSDMALEARDALLAQMTDEVAALVLKDNYEQALAIDVAVAGAATDAGEHEALMEALGLDRALEGLPDSETLAARVRAGGGLTRPELCMLLGHAKIALNRALLDSDLPDDPAMNTCLHEYFPEPIRKAYPDAIVRHQLRREIVATSLANRIVNRMGPTFVADLALKTGAPPPTIARAYITVREALDLPALWSALRKLDNQIPAQVQIHALREIGVAAMRATRRLLAREGCCTESDVPDFGKQIGALAKALEDVLPAEACGYMEGRARELAAQGIPPKLAQRLAALPTLAAGFDIACVAKEVGAAPLAAARAYFAVGDRFGIDWLRGQARALPQGDAWYARAAAAALDALFACQAGLAARALRDAGDAPEPVAAWAQAHAERVAQVAPVLEAMRTAEDAFTLPMLMVAEQRLRGLYGG